MGQPGPNLLLTGKPGCGKTTIIREVVEILSRPAAGFFTQEVRGRDGRRSGFAVVTLDGRRGTLSDINLKGPHRVGRYGVDLECVDLLAVASMYPSDDEQVIVIDEIGKMECLSRAFRDAARRALDGPNPVLGTVAVGGTAFIREVRQRPDVDLIEVTIGNRDRLVGELVETLKTKTKE